MASGMGTIVDATGASGTNSMGSSSCYAWLACGGTGGASMGGAPTGVE